MGLQGSFKFFRPRTCRGLQALPRFRGVPSWPWPQGPHPGRMLKIWGRHSRPLCRGFGVFPSRGKSMYIVYVWLIGVAGGKAVPPDVREEPGGALYVHSP